MASVANAYAKWSLVRIHTWDFKTFQSITNTLHDIRGVHWTPLQISQPHYDGADINITLLMPCMVPSTLTIKSMNEWCRLDSMADVQMGPLTMMFDIMFVNMLTTATWKHPNACPWQLASSKVKLLILMLQFYRPPNMILSANFEYTYDKTTAVESACGYWLLSSCKWTWKNGFTRQMLCACLLSHVLLDSPHVDQHAAVPFIGLVVIPDICSNPVDSADNDPAQTGIYWAASRCCVVVQQRLIDSACIDCSSSCRAVLTCTHHNIISHDTRHPDTCDWIMQLPRLTCDKVAEGSTS